MEKSGLNSRDFYVAFEDKFRGSKELILSRLEAYRPFLKALKGSNVGKKALDLGCGRGEWLEVLAQEGFDASGVDLDDGMIEVAKSRELNVKKGDALTALKETPSDSLAVVSAFHLVEHIPFETLLELVNEAFRVLKDRGILILETPNPENLRVGTEFFYLDPTHQKPIPSHLLKFIPEYIGFGRVEVLRLNEPWGMLDKKPVETIDIFSGVSPDYSIIAIKKPIYGSWRWDRLFQKEYGVSLENISGRFDSRLSRVEEVSFRSEDVLNNYKHIVESFKTTIEYHREEIQSLQNRVDSLHRAYENLLNSKSWKITAPLRGVMEILRTIKYNFKNRK